MTPEEIHDAITMRTYQIVRLEKEIKTLKRQCTHPSRYHKDTRYVSDKECNMSKCTVCGGTVYHAKGIDNG